MKLYTDARDAAESYDRELLLHGPKRNEILELWEVERYGVDSYCDADYVSLYGLCPAEWYAKGVRLLGRTAVECTRDALASAIGRDVAGVAAMAPPGGASPLICDLFAGSGNTLYWLLRHIPGAEGFGCEMDARVFELTRQNLATLGLPIRIVNADYRSGLIGLSAANRPLIAFIAPPWGKALDEARGLDLRRTSPPIIEIVDLLVDAFPAGSLLCAVQVYEMLDGDSVAELRSRFDWSELHLYALNASGRNHGILLGARRWTPATEAR
jgi:hypothetical protein